MDRKQLSRYIKRRLQEQGLSYREFEKLTEKYVPGGIGRQSLTHWVQGKHLPSMEYMALIYFQADPRSDWLFDFASEIMHAVVNIKIKEEKK